MFLKSLSPCSRTFPLAFPPGAGREGRVPSQGGKVGLRNPGLSRSYQQPYFYTSCAEGRGFFRFFSNRAQRAPVFFPFFAHFPNRKSQEFIFSSRGRHRNCSEGLRVRQARGANGWEMGFGSLIPMWAGARRNRFRRFVEFPRQRLLPVATFAWR